MWGWRKDRGRKWAVKQLFHLFCALMGSGLNLLTVKWCGFRSENILGDCLRTESGQTGAWGQFLEVGGGLKEGAGDHPGLESPHSVGSGRGWVPVEVDRQDVR